MSLKNKSIIVTGATSGIGAAIANAIIGQGGRVLVHGLDKAEGAALVANLGPNASLFIEDITSPDAPLRIVEAAISAFGRIDGLINNAARFDRGTLETLSEEIFNEVLAVNLTAPLLMIKAAYSQLKANQGVVLNIGSINSYAGESTLLAYSISKGGLQTMTRNLANAHGIHGIRFNQINPGWVLTENEDNRQIEKGLQRGWEKRLSRNDIPLGQMSTPEQIAQAALYWISEDSYPFTGSVLELEQFSIIGRNSEKL